MDINNAIKYIGRAGNGGGTSRSCRDFVAMACTSVMVVEDTINDLTSGRGCVETRPSYGREIFSVPRRCGQVSSIFGESPTVKTGAR